MHVNELNNDELYQLKDTLYCDFYYNYDGLPDLTNDQRSHIESAELPDDIADEVVYEIYNGVNFVKDDFWCNV